MDTPRDNVLAHALGIAATLFVMLVTVLRPLRSGIMEGLESNLLCALLILVAATLYVLRAALLKQTGFLRTHTEWPALAFAALCVVSLCIASHKLSAFDVAANWIAYLVLFCLVQHATRRDGAWRVLFAAMAATGAILAAYAIYQYYVELPRILRDFTAVKKLYNNDPYAIANHFRRLTGMAVPPDGIVDYEGRLMMRRAMATFVLPNTFAGYLILLLPAVVGFVVDLWPRRRSRSAWPGIAAGLVMAGLMAVSLAQTRSKGAWLCLMAGAGLWIVFRGRRWLLRRWRGAAGLALCAVVLLGVLQWRGKLPEWGEYLGSFRVRLDYWRGGAKIIADHPWLGVGLDGFGDHYAQHIRPQDDESVRAHNNYIQIWCEMGVFGLAAFAAFWVMYFRRLPAADADTPEALHEPGEREQVLVLLGAFMGPIALLMEGFLFHQFATPRKGWPLLGYSFPLALAGTWLLCYVPLAASNLCAGRGLQRGLVLGIICFLLHGFIDIDLYAPGLTQTAWTAAAIAAAMGLSRSNGKARVRLPAWTGVACCALLLAAVFTLAFFVMPRVSRARLQREVAADWESQGRHREAAAAWFEARQANPWDVKAAVQLSWNLWRVAQQQKALPKKLETLRMAADAAQTAIRLRPYSATCRARLGTIMETTAQALRRYPPYRREAARAMWSASQHYLKAVELYPSKPIYRFQAAAALDRIGKKREALEQFRAALRLSSQQRLPRNELSRGQRKVAEQRIKVLSKTASAAHR